MKEVLPMKEPVKISITSNPYLTGAPTVWPTPEPSAEDKIEVFPEMLMAVLSPKPQSENDE